MNLFSVIKLLIIIWLTVFNEIKLLLIIIIRIIKLYSNNQLHIPYYLICVLCIFLNLLDNSMLYTTIMCFTCLCFYIWMKIIYKKKLSWEKQYRYVYKSH